jgi:hypothetical protein
MIGPGFVRVIMDLFPGISSIRAATLEGFSTLKTGRPFDTDGRSTLVLARMAHGTDQTSCRRFASALGSSFDSTPECPLDGRGVVLRGVGRDVQTLGDSSDP